MSRVGVSRVVVAGVAATGMVVTGAATFAPTASATPAVTATAATATPAIAATGTATVSVSVSAGAVHAWPWMSVALPHSVHGHTLSYRYAEAGYQFLVTDGGKPYNNRESAGYMVNFGDHTTPGGGNGLGGASCTTHGRVAGFRDMSSRVLTHHYAKPGRYTVTVTGYYCGLPGHTSTTRRYQVTIH